jgi:isopropylmalate/homocitrate/citramalate synthase
VCFVNPRLVPRLAGAEDVFAAFKRRPGVIDAGLVLNERGYERARAAGVDEVRFAFPVTDTFCLRNQNATVDAALALAQRLVRRARGRPARRHHPGRG